MPKLLQINISANWGSHGKIAEDIGQEVLTRGWSSFIAYGRISNPSKSQLIHIGSTWDEHWHYINSMLFDSHGLSSKNATRILIDSIKQVKPDLIHLHNIHGYYINYPILFEFLRVYRKPVVWTLHDCWSFTGHCTHFEYDRCFKWQTGCYDCQFKHVYPSSLIIEKSRRNYDLKKECFTSLDNLTLVPVSNWLYNHIMKSFLKNQNIYVIHNGVDIGTFKPNKIIRENGVIELLGVASNWKMRKGLPDFIELRKILPENYHLTLIGLTKKEISQLPKGISGLERTNNVHELIEYYNKADILANPTYEDNFPTVNLEALACGTPVITYNTGGSSEAIDDVTGIVVEQGNVKMLAESILKLGGEKDRERRRIACRKRAEQLFNKEICYQKYLDLYISLLKNEIIYCNSNI